MSNSPSWRVKRGLGHRYGTISTRLAPDSHPTMLDIAWAAGIVEGEGHMRHAMTNTQLVAVAQKETWILYKLKSLFGGGVYRHDSAGLASYWRLTGARARGFIMTIYTFLSPHKKAQARNALQVGL